MTELKPCPFCGSKKVRVVTSITAGYVLCDECDAEGPLARLATGESPVDLWNRRHVPEAES